VRPELLGDLGRVALGHRPRTRRVRDEGGLARNQESVVRGVVHVDRQHGHQLLVELERLAHRVALDARSWTGWGCSGNEIPSVGIRRLTIKVIGGEPSRIQALDLLDLLRCEREEFVLPGALGEATGILPQKPKRVSSVRSGISTSASMPTRKGSKDRRKRVSCGKSRSMV